MKDWLFDKEWISSASMGHPCFNAAAYGGHVHWLANDMINILEFADDPAEKMESLFPDAINEAA